MFLNKEKYFFIFAAINKIMYFYYFVRNMIDFGNSPIRKLDNNILQSFSRINSDVEALHASLKNKLNHEIFFCNNHFFGPYIVNNQITISMPFLDYLWYFTYAVFVTEEKIQEYLIKYNKSGEVDLSQTEEGRQVTKCLLQCNYILSMQESNPANNLSNKLDWSDKMTSPINTSLGKKTEYYQEKVNALFVEAVTCILLHETGHCVYNHTATENTTDYEKKVWETEADNFALDLLIRGSEDEIRNHAFGCFLAFISMLFVGRISDKIHDSEHPAIHDRFNRVIEKFKTQSTDKSTLNYLYHFACQVMLLFLQQKQVQIPNYETDNIEDLYNDLLNQLDEFIQ